MTDLHRVMARCFAGEINGIVNFQADAKATAIDHFIDLIDQADDYHDVLRPSATYETKTKPSVMSVRPKFALQGYKDQVEGFFSTTTNGDNRYLLLSSRFPQLGDPAGPRSCRIAEVGSFSGLELVRSCVCTDIAMGSRH